MLFGKHPSETIILTIKPDDGSTVGMEHAVAEFVKNHQDKVYTEGDIPSMKEARGKIVLIRRFKLTQNYEAWQTRAMGLDLTNWDDVSYRDYKYAYKTYDDGKIECISRMHIIHMTVIFIQRSGNI